MTVACVGESLVYTVYGKFLAVFPFMHENENKSNIYNG